MLNSSEMQKINELFLTPLYAHDPYTYWHSIRIAFYLSKLGEELYLPVKDIQLLFVTGLLHDVGKLQIPGKILKKTSPLSSNIVTRELDFGVRTNV